MIEVLVWLLISHGANSASHVVSQHKTQEACEETRKKIAFSMAARCIQANIYIPSGSVK